jgi:hypothetical protein
MNIFSNRPCTPESAAIRARIFNVIPAASYQMEKLFCLFDIEFSDETETACVECRTTPRLLLNTGFVAEYCKDDGDLFLLILHELYHLILGHTRLFPRITPLDNIVFDAVINSILCRTVGRTVGTNLFTQVNGYDSPSERLLRPPPGWPDRFPASLRGLPPREKRVIQLLYGPFEPEGITYHEIYELLRGTLARSELQHVLLLGSHGPEEEINGLLTDSVRRIVEGWPPPPFLIAGRDEGRAAAEFSLKPSEESGSCFLKAMKSILRMCGTYAGASSAVYRRQAIDSWRLIETVLPNARDRRTPALRALLGQTPILCHNEFLERKARPMRAPIVHLYLDVSGSMTNFLPALSAGCRECFARGELRIFAFSNVVSQLRGYDLAKTSFQNTYGTDVNAVLEHITDIPERLRPKVILIATDGYVGPAKRSLVEKLGRTRVVVALTPQGDSQDLQSWVHEIIQLPEL